MDEVIELWNIWAGNSPDHALWHAEVLEAPCSPKADAQYTATVMYRIFGKVFLASVVYVIPLGNKQMLRTSSNLTNLKVCTTFWNFYEAKLPQAWLRNNDDGRLFPVFQNLYEFKPTQGKNVVYLVPNPAKMWCIAHRVFWRVSPLLVIT